MLRLGQILTFASEYQNDNQNQSLCQLNLVIEPKIDYSLSLLYSLL